jgi:hypothetical protein
MEVIEAGSFVIWRDYSQVEFAVGSQLRQIEWSAFYQARFLRSICLPAFVNGIDGTAFSESAISAIRVDPENRHLRVSDAFLLSFDGAVLIQYLGRDLTVRIPPEIEVIRPRAFSIHKTFSAVEFVPDAKLQRIEAHAFLFCRSLQAIQIPPRMDTITGSAFYATTIRQIPIGEGNRLFRVSGDFLLSFDGKVLFHYFGQARRVRILRKVRVITKRAFGDRDILSRIEFDCDRSAVETDGNRRVQCR